MALNCLVAAFSEYCAEPFVVEDIEIVYEVDNRTDITPQFKTTKFTANIDTINSVGSINVNAEQACNYLQRMCLSAKAISEKQIEVEVPITRGGNHFIYLLNYLLNWHVITLDIIQECDIIEDVCIAFGYNNIQLSLPKTPTVGK